MEVRGVGIELMRWGVDFSRKLGFDGRIRLDSSPGALAWYVQRGLKQLEMDAIVHEDIAYTPMELTVQAAKQLLNPRRKKTR